MYDCCFCWSDDSCKHLGKGCEEMRTSACRQPKEGKSCINGKEALLKVSSRRSLCRVEMQRDHYPAGVPIFLPLCHLGHRCVNGYPLSFLLTQKKGRELLGIVRNGEKYW